jgi:flagellar assembly protein FliH
MASDDPHALAHQKFGFDTVFEATGDVVFASPRPKRTYTAEEVDAIRHEAEIVGETRALTARA